MHLLLFEDKKYKLYHSLAELNAEWEDYEKPKDFWFIDDFMIMCGTEGEFTNTEMGSFAKKDIEKLKQIGNYFETEEEAEKAVKKLKAWKRLKDDGLKVRKFELNGGTDRNRCFTGDICLTLDITKPVYEDVIQLLFGDEE